MKCSTRITIRIQNLILKKGICQNLVVQHVFLCFRSKLKMSKALVCLYHLFYISLYQYFLNEVRTGKISSFFNQEKYIFLLKNRFIMGKNQNLNFCYIDGKKFNGGNATETFQIFQSIFCYVSIHNHFNYQIILFKMNFKCQVKKYRVFFNSSDK